MQYLFQNLWSIRGGPRATMTFGSVMHTTIKEFAGGMAKRGKFPFEDVMAVYDREWRSMGFPDDYQEEEYRKAGREQLEGFHRTYLDSPPDMIHQEKSFELHLDHDVIVKGRMDQVNRLGSKEVEIVDYKTGKPKDAKKAKDSLQLSVYALAAEEVLELKPERLVFYNLTTNEAVASAIADLWLYSLGEGWVDSYRTSIRGVTRAEAAQVASRFCFARPPAVVLVGPAEALQRAGEALGQVTVVPATDFI